VNSEHVRIAIVDAGIAGLTAALALTHYGLRCHLFEQTRLLSEVGAGVQLSPNSTQLLHRLGLQNRLLLAHNMPLDFGGDDGIRL
jgi:2-polyprenyl-6-methoxyphenol hydroxylase-like FAD-dependent oxidoreductase